MLGISHREHNTNEYVWQQVSILARPQKILLSTVKRRKLSWLGHVCPHDTLPKDNIKEWTPVDVIIAPRCRGQASMGGRHSGGICRGTPTTPERHGFRLIG